MEQIFPRCLICLTTGSRLLQTKRRIVTFCESRPLISDLGNLFGRGQGTTELQTWEPGSAVRTVIS